MRRGLTRTLTDMMSDHLIKHGDTQYHYMDSQTYTSKGINITNDEFNTLADFHGSDAQGKHLVHILNNHKLLVEEVDYLESIILEIYQDIIPIDKIQNGDPNKDPILSEISSLIAEKYYGSK